MGTGLTFESVQYNNRHYLFNGINNFVAETVSSNAISIRPHGLNPVTEAATSAKVTGHFAQSLGIGYWFFITTELIYPDTKNEIESTNVVPNSKVNYIQIVAADIATSGGKTIKVTRPSVVANSTATHWRLYGDVNRDAPTCPPLSSFQLMAQQQIGTADTLVGDVTLNNTKYPTVVDKSSNWVYTVFALNATDNKYAFTDISGASIQLDTCGFAAISDSVSGIEVTLKMGFLAPFQTTRTIAVEMQVAYGATPDTYTIAENKVLTIKGATFQTLTYGGNSNTWGRDYTTWGASSGADITNANFGVRIVVGRVGDSPMTPCFLDSAEIRVYTASASSTITSYGKYLPVVVTSVGGLVSVLGANDFPPVATTGDVFDSQLVLNDVSDSSIIRYSLPDKPEYFPPIYFINFETKHTDEVTNIGRLNNILVVGLKNSLYRVNYLPRQEDAEFDRGRCYEPIAEDIGIVGTHAACNITLPGGGIVRPFVAYNGLHVTDGGGFDTWSDDIDWKALVSTPASESGTDYLKNCILVNYPVNYQLWFFYTPVGGTTNTSDNSYRCS